MTAACESHRRSRAVPLKIPFYESKPDVPIVETARWRPAPAGFRAPLSSRWSVESRGAQTLEDMVDRSSVFIQLT
jgi:hypothetical protein